MTFEELKQLRKKTDDIVNDAYSELHDAEWAYIEERLPFPFRKYQQVIVKLEVSEETRANMPNTISIAMRMVSKRFIENILLMFCLAYYTKLIRQMQYF